MDPRVKEYLMKKQQGGVEIPLPEEAPMEMPTPKASLYDDYDAKYGDAAMAQAESEAADRKSNLGWSQFAAGMGDALAGRDPYQSAKNFQDIRKGVDDSTIGSLERRKNGAMKNVEVKKTLNNADPNSKESMTFRKMMESQFPKVAAQYGDSWANVSAADQENIFKPLQLKETVEARKEAAALMAGQQKMIRDEKQTEKDALLATPFGKANTADDAKQLKEGFESKKNFDNKIQQMIDLRKKHGGGALMNREDVQRGKQLSKDVLLEYKNMAKLGVLSKSDEDIINAIIPEDPLEYNSPLAAIQGQDPILNRLQKFQGDNNLDFETRVKTRTRDGITTAAQGFQPPPAPKMVKVTDPKGIVRNIPEDQVQSALAAGGKLVQPVAGQ